MIPEDIFLKIVRSAVKAPSSHNTQSWSFAKEDEYICIEPDFNRALPVADPDSRELFISLGCAAETAMIASKFYGYNPILNIESLREEYKIKIMLSKADNVNQAELFPYIRSRQTTRNLFKNTSIPGENIEKLRTTVTENGVNIHFFFSQNEIGQFMPFITKANKIQLSNPQFIKELILWMRFSEKEALQKGDGLYSVCAGFPSMGRMLGNLVMKNMVTAKSENKRLIKQLGNTSAIALFTTSDNKVEDWVKTGMAFQRFALVSTQLGLNHSFHNSPCQIVQVRDKMMNDLRLDGFPQLLIRLGYSQKMPFSFRRRIQNIIKH
jgi:hypothetical protein